MNFDSNRLVTQMLTLFYIVLALQGRAQDAPAENECIYAPLYDLGGMVATLPTQVTSVNSIADCEQACCWFSSCRGFGFKAPDNPSDSGVCYLYGGDDTWWTNLKEYQGDENQFTMQYKRRMPKGYKATPDDCPDGKTCLLNTYTEIFPLAFGEYCNDDPFLIQREYVLETDACVKGYGYSNKIQCIGPGKILWTKYNTYDLECSGKVLARGVFHHPELQNQCTRGLRELHYQFFWEHYCLPDSDVEEIDVSGLLDEDIEDPDKEDPDRQFEEFVKCSQITETNSCLSQSFCDWSWFKFECLQVNLLVNKFEDDQGIAEGCSDVCKTDSNRCLGLNEKGKKIKGVDTNIKETDYGDLASCILERTATGVGNDGCTACVRKGVQDGNFDLKCNYGKKKECLLREWEECVWKGGKCSYKETKVDISGKVNAGRCKKKKGRATQCKKLEGCIWVENSNDCVVDPSFGKNPVEKQRDEGRCGTPTKSVKFSNASKTFPLTLRSSCECMDSCSEYTVWKYKVDNGECSCYDPPPETYLYVEELKRHRSNGEPRYMVSVDKPCFVDCPWMLVDG